MRGIFYALVFLVAFCFAIAILCTGIMILIHPYMQTQENVITWMIGVVAWILFIRFIPKIEEREHFRDRN